MSELPYHLNLASSGPAGAPAVKHEAGASRAGSQKPVAMSAAERRRRRSSVARAALLNLSGHRPDINDTSHSLAGAHLGTGGGAALNRSAYPDDYSVVAEGDQSRMSVGTTGGAQEDDWEDEHELALLQELERLKAVDPNRPEQRFKLIAHLLDLEIPEELNVDAIINNSGGDNNSANNANNANNNNAITQWPEEGPPELRYVAEIFNMEERVKERLQEGYPQAEDPAGVRAHLAQMLQLYLPQQARSQLLRLLTGQDLGVRGLPRISPRTLAIEESTLDALQAEADQLRRTVAQEQAQIAGVAGQVQQAIDGLVGYLEREAQLSARLKRLWKLPQEAQVLEETVERRRLMRSGESKRYGSRQEGFLGAQLEEALALETPEAAQTVLQAQDRAEQELEDQAEALRRELAQLEMAGAQLQEINQRAQAHELDPLVQEYQRRGLAKRFASPPELVAAGGGLPGVSGGGGDRSMLVNSSVALSASSASVLGETGDERRHRQNLELTAELRRMHGIVDVGMDDLGSDHVGDAGIGNASVAASATTTASAGVGAAGDTFKTQLGESASVSSSSSSLSTFSASSSSSLSAPRTATTATAVSAHDTTVVAEDEVDWLQGASQALIWANGVRVELPARLRGLQSVHSSHGVSLGGLVNDPSLSNNTNGSSSTPQLWACLSHLVEPGGAPQQAWFRLQFARPHNQLNQHQNQAQNHQHQSQQQQQRLIEQQIQQLAGRPLRLVSAGWMAPPAGNNSGHPVVYTACPVADLIEKAAEVSLQIEERLVPLEAQLRQLHRQSSKSSSNSSAETLSMAARARLFQEHRALHSEGWFNLQSLLAAVRARWIDWSGKRTALRGWAELLADPSSGFGGASGVNGGVNAGVNGAVGGNVGSVGSAAGASRLDPRALPNLQEYLQRTSQQRRLPHQHQNNHDNYNNHNNNQADGGSGSGRDRNSGGLDDSFTAHLDSDGVFPETPKQPLRSLLVRGGPQKSVAAMAAANLVPMQDPEQLRQQQALLDSLEPELRALLRSLPAGPLRRVLRLRRWVAGVQLVVDANGLGGLNSGGIGGGGGVDSLQHSLASLSSSLSSSSSSSGHGMMLGELDDAAGSPKAAATALLVLARVRLHSGVELTLDSEARLHGIGAVVGWTRAQLLRVQELVNNDTENGNSHNHSRNNSNGAKHHTATNGADGKPLPHKASQQRQQQQQHNQARKTSDANNNHGNGSNGRNNSLDESFDYDALLLRQRTPAPPGKSQNAHDNNAKSSGDSNNGDADTSLVAAIKAASAGHDGGAHTDDDDSASEDSPEELAALESRQPGIAAFDRLTSLVERTVRLLEEFE